jgi:hypothetical protein
MHKPMHFSIRTMLVAMAFFCLAVGLLSWIYHNQPDPITDLFIVYAAGTLVGVGVGHIVHKPNLCTIWGGVLAVLAAFAYGIWRLWMEVRYGW